MVVFRLADRFHTIEALPAVAANGILVVDRPPHRKSTLRVDKRGHPAHFFFVFLCLS
jgi:hypothetical protein